MENPQTISTLLSKNMYEIPLYQRNFSWTDMEITQLLIDVLDSIQDKREEYFLGTLVVSKNENRYSIIDGQQRFTAVLLIAIALQNEFGLCTRYVDFINLDFPSRELSNITFKKLLDNKDIKYNEKEVNDILRGYKQTVNAIKELESMKEYSDISKDRFREYLFTKVKIFINEMPKDLNVNLFFERFNTRGEQLEYHEVVKSELMQKLVNENTDKTDIQKFAKIWDSCSEFNEPVIKFFEKKTKCSADDKEREKVFRNELSKYKSEKSSWRYRFDISDVYSLITVNDENKKSLSSILIDSESKSRSSDRVDEDSNKYRCIVNFNTFLLYTLYLTDNTDSKFVHFDDKKMSELFDVKKRSKSWILQFGENLLKLKFILDNLIIRSSLENIDRRNEGDWFLQKAYREDKNDGHRKPLYVQTRFDRDSFSTKNTEILMIQSMFAVTFTSYKDTKWLYIVLRYLFRNSEKLNDQQFGCSFLLFLENLLKDFALERICTNGNVDRFKLRYDNSVPVFAFNFTDYILWKNRVKLSRNYTKIEAETFRFSYRRSIEHWFPQRIDKSTLVSNISDDLLHSFGNLCLIVASQNSAFSNLYPLAKQANWHRNFATQSLKLQMMAEKTNDWQLWDESNKHQIEEMESYIVEFLNDFVS